MKISDIVSNLLGKYERNMLPEGLKRNKTLESAPPSDNRAVPSDKVEISDEAIRLASLEENSVGRLEEIKSAVNNGTYNPPLSEVAKSILEEWENE